MILQIQLFGGFRQFENQGKIQIEVSPGITAKEIKEIIFQGFAQHPQVASLRGLLDSSVLATEDTILDPNDKVLETSPLALLPPVCGG